MHSVTPYLPVILSAAKDLLSRFKIRQSRSLVASLAGMTGQGLRLNEADFRLGTLAGC